jgi:ribosomal protein L11 methyltransferase
LQVECRVDPNEVDVVSGALWGAGVSGIEERGGRAATTLVVALRRRVLPAVTTILDGRATTVGPVAVDWGLDAWREYAAPIVVDQVVVVPSWLDPPPGSPEVVMIDPGRAFGSGSHATTQLALTLLQGQELGGARVLDVGTGSGVLAIAAVKLGASRVVAIDVDPEAVDAALANAARNEVADRIDVRRQALGDLSTSFDLVVANLTAPVLVESAEAVVSHLEPKGRLIVSGVLADQADEVRASYRAVRWTTRIAALGWTAWAGVRSA